MVWTDRIRQVKIVLVGAAVVFAAASLVVSHYLVRDLAIEEHNRMEVWAEAMRSLNKADENTDLNLVLKVIDENNTIPVVVTDAEGNATIFRNVKLQGDNYNDSLADATRQAARMKAAGRCIKIDKELVCYDESVMITRLSYYPYVQLGIVLIFVVIAIFALLTSKRAEQNKVWVGLSKETAHQLGTPISSLMAWTEILREEYPDDELIPEMDKDVKRLQLIAERFSKIGSIPEPVDTPLAEMLHHVVDYMDRRTSQKVQIIDQFSDCKAHVLVNSSLFEWVLENLCKNAVDAMGGPGTITIKAMPSPSALPRREGTANASSAFRLPAPVIIDVTDTGKGIEKKNIKNVFKPGFTTKKRGWGLGLSLAKRIVEEYHHGKIYVLRSEVGKGTTFRIEI